MVSISEGDALAACGSFAFAHAVVEGCPYTSRDALIDRARQIWWTEVNILDDLDLKAADTASFPFAASSSATLIPALSFLTCTGADQGLAASL